MCYYSLYTFANMISIYIVLLFVLLTNAEKNNVSSTVRIYSNLAEVIQPLGKLPLEFSEDDWNNLRSDSITLVGEHVNITLQTITETKKSFNGTEIYIRSPVSADKTTVKLIKAILVDEINHLVKIEDPSIADGRSLYFTVPYDDIYYLEEPTKARYYVNFTYLSFDSNVFVSYLRSNLYWQTQYRLNLYSDESDLIAMANIRNNGKSSVSIDQAELIGGDINLQMQQSNDLPFRKSRFDGELRSQVQLSSFEMLPNNAPEPTVEQGKELAGLYVFPITKPFTIDAKTNYLLPMFRPHVTVERYASISKIFSPVSMTGKAQRYYRLKSDRYLSQGNCIIREDDRIVGETGLPNIAAKDNYEFSIGEDADIVYKENITLTSSKELNETDLNGEISNTMDASPPIVIIKRMRFVYNVHVELKNYKARPVKVEYEQKGLHTYHNVSMTTPREHHFIRDGSSIKSNITLKANAVEKFSFTLVLVR